MPDEHRHKNPEQNTSKLKKKQNKIRVTTKSSNSTPGHISRKDENANSKNTCTPMFITALSIIAKVWKQRKCPSTWSSCKMQRKYIKMPDPQGRGESEDR